MAKGLTDRQQEVFNFVVAYIEEKGYPPTIREMQVGLSIGSLRGVTIHLDALHRKGFIERLSSKNGPRTSRGIRVLTRTEHARDIDKGVLRLPLIGAIAAGTPLLARQNIEDVIPIPMDLIQGEGRNHFLLRIQGESMTGAHILPGDLVIVQPQTKADNNDIVAARLGEEVAVRRLSRHGSRMELEPQNPNYAPRPLHKTDDAAIIGKVVGLIRGFSR